ncbi:MAG TPA: phenylalanine--tRNA ligase subunit beta [Gemmatimonadaceae bacterium]|nr:phenylalanine--tRNA ligase subunit beta [Gemmatimonadaceae bacterium]
MNASYRWLEALCPTGRTPAELRDLITARCCTVDEVVPLRQDLAQVVIARVIAAEPHPDSDHLTLTQVDAGLGEPLQVICGAPNVRVGGVYPFAPAGTTLPGGLRLEKRKIRGVISNGMLCSARELHLGEEHEGILELNTDAAPGTPFLAAVDVGDTRLVIDVTPNRADLLSHAGLAREIAAATGVAWSLPALPGGGAQAAPIPPAVRAPREGEAGGIRVRLDDEEGAPRYMGVVIRGITVGASPLWLAERLAAVGARSVNNVVDATNYVLHEIGHPTHAFDLSRLAGGTIVIRRACAGERVVTLDGVERVLHTDSTVIADAERAQAIAGVMGGADSEVRPETRDIFLEVACFDPVRTRRSRRAAGLSTDASYRFERGVDVDALPAALERAAQLIVALAGGRVDGAPVDLYPQPRRARVVALRPARVAALLGEPLESGRIAALLRSIGFHVADGPSGHALDVTVPGWRFDVEREVDLIEEVARLHGYDAFSSELRPFRPGAVPDAPLVHVQRAMRHTLVAAGLREVRPMPFVSTPSPHGAPDGTADGAAGQAGAALTVRNPLAATEAHLRSSLMDTLAARAEFNLRQMHRAIRIFEIGHAFVPANGALALREEVRAAALIMGERTPRHWTQPATPDVDVWDAKALAEDMARALARDDAELVPAPPDAPEGLLWYVRAGGEPVGTVRRLALDAPPWAPAAFGVEVTLGQLDAAPVAPPGHAAHGAAPAARATGEPQRYRPLASTPASEVDLALLVPHGVNAADVERVIRRESGAILERLSLFDEYRGEHVPSGQRSLAWRLTFRDPVRTLRDREIAGRRERLLRALEGELGVRQRTS